MIILKKYFIAVISALLVGGLLAMYIFSSKTTDDEVFAISDLNKVYLFQMGVYSNLENASDSINELHSAIVKEYNNYYYVYGAIYSDTYLVNILKNYYDEEKIDYSN